MDINIPVHDEEDIDKENSEISEDENNEKNENVRDDVDEEAQEERDTIRRADRTRMKFSMTYRDVANSIKTFNGKDVYQIKIWPNLTQRIFFNGQNKKYLQKDR